MKVRLLAHTPEPERLIAAAAKNCYSSVDVDGILDGLTEEKTQSFLQMLTEIGHESPIEHVSFSFAIEGVSRSLLAQITRHRLASYSVQSQRYVREHGFEYVVPPEIEKIPEAKQKFIAAMESDQRTYEELTAVLMEEHLHTLLDAGVPEKQARNQAEKKAIEDARYVLPNACTTRIVMTANARSLQNFFRLRCCNRAQWEIRALAEEMYKLVYAVAPTLFSKTGPSCVDGACTEGKMCCGHAAEVRAHYLALREGITKQA
ncbi:MAG: FAD-dependent thymidylate synthase [Butyricicoccus sp.]|nr:FAD-dependent thymidylate synthase [Butyricicoccus sp.]